MDSLWIITLACYAFCVAQSIYSLTTERGVLRTASLIALAAGFAAHTAWLLQQGLRMGRWPLVGTQETFAFLGWGLVLAYLAAFRWYRVNALKAFIFPILLVITTIAAISPTTLVTPETTSTLQRILFPLHAGLILLAYASFSLAFGAGVMYILQERALRSRRLRSLFYRLPSLDTCDLISFRSMAVGFVFLTLGIAAGIGWQRARDGLFWHGDSIEIFSVSTWVIYLFLIQSRIAAGWGGRTAAMASIVSFVIVVFSLVGVRYFGTLHVFG